MNFRKIMIVLSSLLFIILITSCGKNDSLTDTDPAPSDTAILKEMCDIVVEKMRTINGDENYRSLMSSSNELSDLIKEWSGYQPDDCTDILVIPITEKLVQSYTHSTTFDQLNDTAKEYEIRRIASSLGSFMSSTYAGTATMAASSVSCYSETFRIDKDTVDNQVWLISCTDSVGIIVSFVNTGDKVTTVSASYCAIPEPESREKLLSLLFGGSTYQDIGAYPLPSGT